MTVQQTPFPSPKSIAGAALVGIGLFILLENLDVAATQLNHLLGTTLGEALGSLPTVILAASQVLQACAFDHQRFLPALLQVLISFWPLALVIVGAVLLWKAFAIEVKALRQLTVLPPRYRTCPFRCPPFDV
jgi:xanthine/uracil/vitamin C permease (AzgA family)